MLGQKLGQEFAQRAARGAVCGVYAITPQLGSDWPLQGLLECLQAALEGGVRLVQFRQKMLDDDVYVKAYQAVFALCAEYKACLVLNDGNALRHQGLNLPMPHGVHLGQEDMPLAQARQAWPPSVWLGASCYNRLDLAQQAVQNGADVVAFGAMFVSKTKPHAVHAPLALLTQAQGLGVPVVAIGGVDLQHVPVLKAAGASAVAVISALFGDTPRPGAVHERAKIWCCAWSSWGC